MASTAKNHPPTKIAVATSHTVLLGDGGKKLYAWGKNQYNVLHISQFDANTNSRSDPNQQLVTRISDAKWASSKLPGRAYQVTCGSNHTSVLIKSPDDLGGDVYSWGFGTRGRLGHHDPDAQASDEIEDNWQAPHPLRAELPTTVKIKRIDSGADFTLATAIDNSLWVWGTNTDGQLGLGHDRDARLPTQNPMFGPHCPVAHAACGSRHSMVCAKDGALYVMGTTGNGRLGLGKNVRDPKKVAVTLCDGLTGVHFVACGEAHSAGVSTTLSLCTWGAGSFGRLGHGDTLDAPLPAPVQSLQMEKIKSISLGAFHSVALTSKGKLYTWGSGAPLGYMKDGDNSVMPVPKLIHFDFFGPVLQVACGMFHTLVLCSGGKVAVWGLGSNARLGCGPTLSNITKPVFMELANGKQFSDAIRNTDLIDSCEKKKDLEDAGAAGAGRGGDGGDSGPQWGIKQLCCGSMNSAALTHNGALYVWGTSEGGQGGHGTYTDLWLPKRLLLARPVEKIAFGYDHCLAITQGIPELYAWGRGGQGQLGIGRAKGSAEPVLVNMPDGSAVVDCAAGELHSAAVTNNGYLYTWGSAENGCLGHGSQAASGQQPNPTRVESKSLGGKLCMRVGCGMNHTGVITTDGDLYTFGAGWYGRLGLRESDNVYEPQRVLVHETGPHIRFQKLAMGGYMTCAVDSREEMYIMGRDRCVCEPEHLLAPKKFVHLGEGVRVKQICCCESHSLCVTNDGEVWGWGDNSFRQLALPPSQTRTDIHMPHHASTFPGTVALIATGPSHSLATLTTGDVYAWGDQSCGRLGLQQKGDTGPQVNLRYQSWPMKTEAVWASIEAMTFGGAKEAEVHEDSDEEMDLPGADDGKDVRARDDGKKAQNMERMLGSIREGQSISEFKTMQSLIKQEAVAAKEPALLAMEKALHAEYETFLKDICFNITEVEKRSQSSFTDFQTALNSTLKYMPAIRPPDFHKSTKKRGGGARLLQFLPCYEELMWALQQQVCYLSELSMVIAGDKDREKIFYRFISCLYRELDDARTLHLLMALLKLMMEKEIEEAKSPDEVFQPESSRVFHVFSQAFALHPYYQSQIVHSVMDTGKKTDGGSLLATLDAGVKEHGHYFYLTKDEFLQSQRGDDMKDPQELNAEFNLNVEKFREYTTVDFLKWLEQQNLPNFLHEDEKEIFRSQIMSHALEEIKHRRFTVKQTDITISADLHLCEPLMRLYIHGLMLPQLNDFDSYSGKQVGLGGAVQLHIAQDPTIRNNVKKLSVFLKKTADRLFTDKDKQLMLVARQVKPALLGFCKTQASRVLDDTDTQLTIDVFCSHYDRQPHYVQMKTSDLMQISNMLLEAENKIRLTQNDYVCTRILKRIGEWSENDLQMSVKEDYVYNFKINNRFLLEAKSMTFCKTSKVPVPRKLSALGEKAENDDTEEVIEVVKGYQMPEDAGDPRRVLEQLFYLLPDLEAGNFKDMRLEFDELKKMYINMAPPDYDTARKLEDGMKKLDELIQTEATLDDVLGYMTDQLSMRDKQKSYLEYVQRGKTTIQAARNTYYGAIEKSIVEVKLLKQFAEELRMPKEIRDQANETGVTLHLAKIKTKKIDKVRTVDPSSIPEGCSFSPQVSYNYQQLVSMKVLKSLSHPETDSLLTSKAKQKNKTKLLFTFSYNQTGGLDVVCTFLESKKKTALIQKFTVSGQYMQEYKKACAGVEAANNEAGDKGAGAGGGAQVDETIMLGGDFMTVYLLGFVELSRKVSTGS